MRLKEFLSVRAIDFVSVNVLEDQQGYAELQRLGVRSIPVLTRGDRFVFAQSLKPVVEFLGLDEKTGPVLSPATLYDRLDRYLAAELALLPLMPGAELGRHVPGRPRSYRALAFHTFKVVEAFLAATRGETLVAATFGETPPDQADTAWLVDYGTTVHQRFRAWWSAGIGTSGTETLSTFYGPQSLHELLERTTWHAGQHVRQWMMLLQMQGVNFERPLVDADFHDLPMPANVWDG